MARSHQLVVGDELERIKLPLRDTGEGFEALLAGFFVGLGLDSGSARFRRTWTLDDCPFVELSNIWVYLWIGMGMRRRARASMDDGSVLEFSLKILSLDIVWLLRLSN